MSAQPATVSNNAPSQPKEQSNEEQGRFMVVFKPDTPDEVVKQSIADVEKQGGTIHHEFSSLMKGYSATLPTGFFAQLQGHEHVNFIEPDQTVTTQ
ncbi:hypothetical protein H4R33_003748 [Dimargaris cristalligena]|uniref:Inhibitor I9 domain-containing protein n=1 Tax=Dimargaris cristalligena TaxID=215637 RepID=A0A4P9ZK85_9FUNG|nr:hypothetical protein H4R33_003748 [Dimargaris cristalligena]RKP33493.1 hypothetical protein BJ085DRAFT_38980 [Dimargaris cristalligena]|eukprot:RKP33493.1 hypothetical protein BJ085DRAFT_38980 [Dimargaris cristalligena]